MTPEEEERYVAAQIVRLIVMPTSQVDGPVEDIIDLLELVVSGVFAVTVKVGGDEPVIDIFASRLRERMKEIRLAMVKPAGEA